jgi:hypothetical protein
MRKCSPLTEVPPHRTRNPAPLDRLFLHFFDVHFLDDVVDSGTPGDRITAECTMALRLALMCAETVYLPAAAYYESDICRTVTAEFTDLFGSGRLVLVGGADSPREFAEEKLAQYDDGSAQASAYRAVLTSPVDAPPFRARQRSATADVRNAWLDIADTPQYLDTLFGPSFTAEKDTVDKRWRDIPADLDGRAFIPGYVQPLLLTDAPLMMRRRISGQINRSYFASYSTELRSGYVTDLVFLGNGSPVDDRFGNLPFTALRNELLRENLLTRVVDASPSELVNLHTVPEIAMVLLAVLGNRPTGTPFAQTLDELEPELEPQVAKLHAIPSGIRGATRYHRHIAELVSQIFVRQLGPAVIEKPINDDRKRLDIFWPNQAIDQVFAWLGFRYNARNVIGECKNYVSDPKNPEVDQLLGRFSPVRGEFGLLLCRKVKDRERATNRSRDAFLAGRGLAIILDDDDIATMAGLRRDGGWGAESAAGWLTAERINPLI